MAIGAAKFEAVLQEVWGFARLRGKQGEICEAISAGKDCGVFWATGAGKSMCYQLPALAMEKCVCVVSPLVSLMQDQVIKLISTTGNQQTATFLGSAQQSQHVEDNARAGLYSLVYCTPEKFVQPAFMEDMRDLFHAGKLGFVAIDEAHCVSEWGHDFRPEFRRIGSFRDICPKCPIMALTATAVPAVREDVLRMLKLREPVVSITSVDRPNLSINALNAGAVGSGKKDKARIFAEKYTERPGSTIVYCATTKQVDDTANEISAALGLKASISKYHGKMSHTDREDSHRGFLTGEHDIIVATVAFGMGIDKADIRSVWHFGPPKTFEEYYQQVGRAGRDGLPATCTMIYDAAAFARYDSDFYATGSATADMMQKKSRAALQSFAENRSTCRRASLVEYFSGGKESLPGGACGSCDNCRASKLHAGDQTRNFTREAIAVLRPLTRLRTSSATKLISKIKLEDHGGIRRSDGFWKEFLQLLVEQDYLARRSVKGDYRAYSVYGVTPKGSEVMRRPSAQKIILPVPDTVRHQEAKFKSRLAEMEASGVDLQSIPREEISAGHGPTLDAEEQWISMLERYRRSGNSDRADKLLELLERLRGWRRDEAVAIGRIAPVNVSTEAMLKQACYVQPTSEDGLRALGFRIGNIARLAELLKSSLEEFGWESLATTPKEAESSDELILLSRPWQHPEKGGYVLPAGIPTTAGASLRSLPASINTAPTKALVAQGLTPAQISAVRFAGGEHIVSIAGKQHKKDGSLKAPVQVSTVVGHLLKEAAEGMPIDVKRIVAEGGRKNVMLPNKNDWNRLKSAFQQVGTDPKQLQVPIGEAVKLVCPASAIPFNERTSAEKANVSEWYSKAKWFTFLMFVQYPLAFTDKSDSSGNRDDSSMKRRKLDSKSSSAQSGGMVTTLLDGLDSDDLGFDDSE